MRLNWRKELLVLATLAMETCWVYAWLRFLLTSGSQPQSYLSLATVFGTLLVSTYTGRALTGSIEHLHFRQVILSILVVAGVLLAIWHSLYQGTSLWNLSWLARFITAVGRIGYRETVALIALVGLWWRGLNHARGLFSVPATGFRFRLGVVALMWLFIAGIILPVPYFNRILFLFFTIALLAMALARIEEVSAANEGQPVPFNRFWLGVVVGATLVSLLVAATASTIFSLSTIYRLLSWMDPIFSVLDVLLYQLLVIIARLLEPLMALLIQMGREVYQVLQNRPLGLPVLTPTPGELPPAAPPEFLQIILKLLRWIVLVALGLLALILLARELQKQRQRQLDLVPELRESVWSAEAFRQDVEAWLDLARQRLGDRVKLRSRLHKAYATATIRQIYGSLLRWAAEQGYPRPLPSTPYEYLPVLVGALAEGEADVREITEAYVQVHYAEALTSAEDLARVRRAWERVQRLHSAKG